MAEDTLPLERLTPTREESVDVALDSPAIRRLIDEVRIEQLDVSRSYNRTFNRHNRGR